MSICNECWGKGWIKKQGVQFDCRKCKGTGVIENEPPTNEEWFCALPTKDKAKWLYDHYVNARAEEFYGRPEKTLSEYQKWLVSVHREIDGTKID